MMQDHVYELEKRHYEIVAQYEEEISRLRALLEGRGVPAHELCLLYTSPSPRDRG